MMNLGNNLMSFLEVMSNPTASPQVSGFAQKASMDPAGSQNFGNLLDLVSDLELVESQDVSKSFNLDAELSQLLSPEKEKLEFDSNEGQLSRLLLEAQGFQGIPNVNVGQDLLSSAQFKEAGKASLETSSVSDLLLQGQELQAKSNVEVAHKGDIRSSKIDVESLSQWSSALLSGDMKAVHVEGDLNSLNGVAQGAARFEQAGLDTTSLNTLGESVEGDVSSLNKEASVSHVSQKQGVNHADIGREHGSNHRQNERNSRERSFSSSLNQVSSQFEKDKSNFEMFGESKVDSSLSKSGSDFLLENSISSNSLTAATGIPASAIGLRLQQGVVSSRASLGEQSDNRISPQNLDFVAEKISNLKSQGGGNLRIDLAPKEMGAIEIRVGMKNGVLNVELKAEQLSTQNSLDASKLELLGKLEKMGPAQVQVGSTSTSSLVAGHEKLSHSPSSEAFLNSRNGQASVTSNSAQAQNLQLNSQGVDRGALLNAQSGGDKGSQWLDSSRTSSSTAQSDNAWGRDERREQARNRWEENFSQRKSA